MMHEFLGQRLRRIHRREQLRRIGWQLGLCWIVGVMVASLVLWIGRVTGWASPVTLPLLAVLVITAGIGVVIRRLVIKPDYRSLAERVEKAHPNLGGLVLTAAQQEVKAGVEPSYLQHLLLQQAIERSQERDWRQLVPRWQIATAHVAQLAALALLVFAFMSARHFADLSPAERATLAWKNELTITPGDTEIERGDSLVVLARFGNSAPASVELIINEPNVPRRKVRLVKSLADPVFGGTVPEVLSNFTYRVEYGREESREFKVTVFEHPRLERADVQLTFPTYTKLEAKRIEDTRRVSAVEGTKAEFALQLNKPVKSARLVARDKNKTVIPLVAAEGRALATLPEFVLAASQTYDLQLVDADGRANKQSTPFVIDVQANRRPELRLVSPRGDVRPSALEEITFEGTVWDDFGAPAFGFAFAEAGKDMTYVELGRDLPPKDKRAIKHLLRLEDLGVKPDDLVSWHLWADDVGPDGQVRRTNSDLYFAEVRPFDEIFREDSGMGGGQDDQPGAAGDSGPQAARKLTELQKQIISATWKLQRDPSSKTYKADAEVVRDSQVQALEQARTGAQQVPIPRIQAQLNSAARQMEEAASRLNEATEKPESLKPALAAEQAAYQTLLKLNQRETNVTRNRNRGGGQGGDQSNQRQLDQLDLAQSENRYETQRQAKAPQNQERREQLQVQNRLQELARRQHDVNERLKELQTALQEARTEKEKEELRRQLKRLQDEQREMLADVDELRQRMERPENQSRMSEQRKELDRAREDLQRASDATGDGSVAQALASGTRAQRQLQDLRDTLRKENSSQFADELRDMRGEAREVARQEQEISQKLAELKESKRKTLSDEPERKTLGEDLSKQQQRFQDLVDRATKLSEQAENTEPLLSRHLYESLRKVSQDDANAAKHIQQEMFEAGTMTRGLMDRLKKNDGKEGTKAFDIASELLREGLLPQAVNAERKARAGVDELRRGVERAAGSVLGDDAEALRLAQSELEALTEQLRKEEGQENSQGQGDPGNKGQLAQQGRPGQPGQSGEKGQPGEQGQPGQGGQQAQEGRPGQEGEKGRIAAEGGKAGEGQSKQGSDSPPGEGQGGRGERQVARSDRPGESGQGERPSEQGGKSGGRGQADAQERAGEQAGGERPGRERAERGGQGGGLAQGGARGDAREGGGAVRTGELDLNQLLDQLGGRPGGEERSADSRGLRAGLGGPITGGDFGTWAERLRDVEDVLDVPDLRNAVASARERARLLRQEYRRDLKKPDWTVVRLEIMKPLIEVRARITDELARRENNDPLAPVDRDPVPPRFTESVRKYYEDLGKDR